MSERWIYGGRARLPVSDARQCRYCGSFAGTSGDCAVATCMLCGSPQCFGNGSGNGCCKVCHYGWLPGWSRGYSAATARSCAYKGCEAEPVATCRKRAVCAEHAKRIKASKDRTLAEYVAERIAHRDSGKGWEYWRLVA